MIKLPRLPINWREQPQLFERYWDDLLRNLEKNIFKTDGITVDLSDIDTAISGLQGVTTSLAEDVNDLTIRTDPLVATQTSNTFLAAPSGAAGTPSFRTIASVDIPTLNQNTTGTSSNVTGTVAVSNGGTGGTSAAAAKTNLGLATVASSGSFTDLTDKPGVQSTGQNVISSNKTLGASDKGTNILIGTSGITITFPATGFASGEGVAISNISGGSVTFAFPGGSDMSTTLPATGSLLVFSDGGGFWRQYCYSSSKL